ncbi:hypothetical protein KKJFFJLC_00055 [Vibrio phage vB_VpaS_PGB]|nr:hypothetical protein HHKILHMN_00042 [Vibrio phage vB_VpaS_PGA]WVH05598.1 hypothetical protein KKJFFJLC_00055 [Vibrio phage vB_VpaS_PGB]
MPYEFITSTGTVIPDTSTIRQEVINEIVEVFGISEEIASDSSTLEGRLVDSETEARKSVAINNAKLSNQINPNLAEDGFFDAIYALFGGERDSSTRSSTTLLLTGVAGTVIPINSFVRNSVTKTLWYTTTEVTLDSSGNATVTANSEDTGSVVGAANDINEIVSGVVGWETVTNPMNATEGRDLQSLTNAKLERARQLHLNAGTTMGAVISNIGAIDDVIGVSGRENYTNNPLLIDGITIPPKSTWVCVDGGDDAEIAEQYVIHTHGTGFYGFNNTVAGEYTDPISGQIYDSSNVPVNFDRPTEVPIKIEVTARLVSSTDLVTQIKAGIQEWISGNIEGYRGGSLANDISPFEISSALNEYFTAPTVYVGKVRITTVADDTLSTNDIEINLWEKATVTNENITVVSA